MQVMVLIRAKSGLNLGQRYADSGLEVAQVWTMINPAAPDPDLGPPLGADSNWKTVPLPLRQSSLL